jgi:hypothetical protein
VVVAGRSDYAGLRPVRLIGVPQRFHSRCQRSQTKTTIALAIVKTSKVSVDCASYPGALAQQIKILASNVGMILRLGYVARAYLAPALFLIRIK